jgi:hypothetical protein
MSKNVSSKIQVKSDAAQHDAGTTSKTHPTLNVYYLSLTAALMVIVLAVGGYFIYRGKHTPEADTILAEVQSRILLPQGEVPTLATVSDVNKLKSQPFFVKAANGDKVIIFAQAKKAILYRPSTKQIIEVGPVNMNSVPTVKTDQPTSQPSPSFSDLKVAIYNGTLITGLAGRVENRLTSEYPGLRVVYTGNAKKRTYTKTAVVDVSGRKKAETEAFAKRLGAEIQELPKEENKPSADILIIAAE